MATEEVDALRAEVARLKSEMKQQFDLLSPLATVGREVVEHHSDPCCICECSGGEHDCCCEIGQYLKWKAEHLVDVLEGKSHG